MRFLLPALLLLSLYTSAQLPSYPRVVEAFFNKYNAPEDYRQAVVFAKKKEGWYAHVIDRRNDSVLLAEAFWTGGRYLPLKRFEKAEAGRPAKERRDRFLKDPTSYSRYGYERCRYFGYPTWARDMIRDFGKGKPEALSDTLLEGLARANSALVTNFFYDRFGDVQSTLPKLSPLEQPSRARVDSAIFYLDKSLNAYDLLAKRNPGYRTLVGNSVAKKLNEYVFAWMELEMAGDSAAAKRFLDRSPRRTEVSAYARNYLAPLPPNSILFTYGDDDTYPLLWEQRVNGTRKDVTVINLSLLGLPKYIHGLKENGLRFDAPEAYYAHPAHLYASKTLASKNHASLSELLEFLYTEKGQSVTEDGTFYSYDLDGVSLPVQKQQLASFATGIPLTDSVAIPLPAYLTLDQVLLLDILQSNLYERPIFFTSLEQLFASQMVSLGTLYQFLPAVDNWGLANPSLVRQRDSSFLSQFKAASFDAAKGETRFDRDPSVFYLFAQADEALRQADKASATRLLNMVTRMYGNQLPHDPNGPAMVKIYLDAGLTRQGADLATYQAKEAIRIHQQPTATDFYALDREQLADYLALLAQTLEKLPVEAQRIKAWEKKYRGK